MPRVIWKHKLRLEDIFHSEAHSFTNRRDIIVARIQRSKFWDEDDDELAALVEELADTEDGEAFNRVWDALYDWFDANRVWVATA
jgi:hypothetical protein